MKILPIVTALLLAACSKPVSFESVEALMANPERLRELRAQCKADQTKVGDAQCNAVAEATKKRFMRPGKSPYVADPVPPAPAAAKD